MIVLTFSITKDCTEHLLYMRNSSSIWRLKYIIQVIIAVNICFLNALLCAGQNSGFSMLMASLSLMSLNNIDNILAKLFIVIGGISAVKPKVKILSKQDHMFSRGIAIPHLLWVTAYSLVFLGFVPIEHPPTFVMTVQLVQSAGAAGFIVIWYFVCYSCPCIPSSEDEVTPKDVELGETPSYDEAKGTIDHRRSDQRK
jgi:hypothetical protein